MMQKIKKLSDLPLNELIAEKNSVERYQHLELQ